LLPAKVNITATRSSAVRALDAASKTRLSSKPDRIAVAIVKTLSVECELASCVYLVYRLFNAGHQRRHNVTHCVDSQAIVYRHTETSPCLDFHLDIDLHSPALLFQTLWRLCHIMIDLKLLADHRNVHAYGRLYPSCLSYLFVVCYVRIVAKWYALPKIV